MNHMSYKYLLGLGLILSTPSALIASGTLVFAVDVIRHGDRTPLISLPSVPYQWKEGLGQLTAEGMQQEYELGTALRKKYVEQAHLLPEHYEHGTMYVRSTDYHRTLMSAQTFLMGLYPPGTGPNTTESSLPALPYAFQPIPVFSAPAQYDEIILQQLTQEEHDRLMQEYVYSTPEWQQKNNELKENYPFWSRVTGVSIKGLNDLQLLGDSLFVHKVHHAPMPEGLSTTDIETIIAASNWAFMAQEKSPEVARVYSSKMMTHIANYLNNGRQKQVKMKYVLLSAHDTTIAGALSYLGAPLHQPPPYASNLNFSLYENDTGYFTVKISYNGKAVFIPACGGDVCELDQFLNLNSAVESQKV